MSDDFQTGICGGNWWNVARSGGFDGPTLPAATASGSCSAAIGSGGGAFSWTVVETAEGKARSCDEPSGSASGSSITFQDSHKAQPSDHVVGGPLMDSSTLQIPGFGLSPSAMDWTQALLRSSGRAETSFHAMLQDDLSSKPFFHQDPSIDSDQVHTGSDMNHSMLLDQHHLSSGNEPGDCGINNLFEPNTINPHQSIYDNRSMNYQSPMMGYRGSPSDLSQPSWPKFSQFMIKASPPKQQSTNQLHFLNNTPFWNASAAAASQVRLGYYPQKTPTQFTTQNFDQKPNCSKANSGGARDSSSSSSMTKKSSSSEPASKKPRVETPSPLPTFKVRKEKLGDRITALQQLVSPFGKTDTASVLHEAIEYIKFLHDQVGVLSSPYLKNGHPMQHQQQNPDKPKDGEGPEQDLRSRGLCLVPISSTYPMASETPMEFWNPTFGGTNR